MAAKTGRKRAATSNKTAGPSKKRKLAVTSSKPAKDSLGSKRAKAKGQQRASDRPTIPIPVVDDEVDGQLSEDALQGLDELGSAAHFLGTIDAVGIARSKKETQRLHALTKPARSLPRDDDLPSVDSHSDAGSWSSGLDDMSELGEDDEAGPSSTSEEEAGDGFASNSDDEMPYETAPRRRRPSWESDSDQGVERLPIKLANGFVRRTGERIKVLPDHDNDSDNLEYDELPIPPPPPIRQDVATGARFGRRAVADVLATKSRSARLREAKEQIAGICQEILGDPENSLGLLRRLHSFSLPAISTPTQTEPVPNDVVIRKLAILSQSAVFKDIIPGYRIRPLTDKEKAEKVSQMVARSRDWEQGLVGVYQNYLRTLDQEIKAKSDLAEISLRCMCMLLKEAMHFNFRVNIMNSVIAHLSRKSWSETSDLCLETVIGVFKADLDGQASLEAVRLLNRMVRERKFTVNPRVLSCLLHLRLKQELGVRASESRADKPGADQNQKQQLSRNKAAQRRAKGKPSSQPHLSKTAKKALKERKAIEKEMHEASAEVDGEERATNQTETLKLVFVLYFRILKHPTSTPLLPVVLQGISRYAHLVNIDFFKDLMRVLHDLIDRDSDVAAEQSDRPDGSNLPESDLRLRCIVTAFELLTGQGEALNIDLTNIVNKLYALIPTLSLDRRWEDATVTATADSRTSSNVHHLDQSAADLLFRALHLAFSTRASGPPPAWRSAAFSKRLLTACLHWPDAEVLRTLEFVRGLLATEPKLEALLCTDDRASDGVYRPEVEDPQLCRPFGTSWHELHLLRDGHVSAEVRGKADKVMRYERQ